MGIIFSNLIKCLKIRRKTASCKDFLSASSIWMQHGSMVLSQSIACFLLSNVVVRICCLRTYPKTWELFNWVMTSCIDNSFSENLFRVLHLYRITTLCSYWVYFELFKQYLFFQTGGTVIFNRVVFSFIHFLWVYMDIGTPFF